MYVCVNVYIANGLYLKIWKQLGFFFSTARKHPNSRVLAWGWRMGVWRCGDGAADSGCTVEKSRERDRKREKGRGVSPGGGEREREREENVKKETPKKKG